MVVVNIKLEKGEKTMNADKARQYFLLHLMFSIASVIAGLYAIIKQGPIDGFILEAIMAMVPNVCEIIKSRFEKECEDSQTIRKFDVITMIIGIIYITLAIVVTTTGIYSNFVIEYIVRRITVIILSGFPVRQICLTIYFAKKSQL